MNALLVMALFATITKANVKRGELGVSTAPPLTQVAPVKVIKPLWLP
jgi:hypothetical protein